MEHPFFLKAVLHFLIKFASHQNTRGSRQEATRVGFLLPKSDVGHESYNVNHTRGQISALHTLALRKAASLCFTSATLLGSLDFESIKLHGNRVRDEGYRLGRDGSKFSKKKLRLRRNEFATISCSRGLRRFSLKNNKTATPYQPAVSYNHHLFPVFRKLLVPAGEQVRS